jgi:hypothetical protein
MKIHQITSKLDRMTLEEGNLWLRLMIQTEKPRSVRRGELESLLRDRVVKQLRKETPGRRRLRKYRVERAA